MIGKIGIRNLRIHCIIGCNPEERIEKQDILIDMDIESDCSACILSDDINDTINYVEAAALCAEIARVKKYSLLEALAHDILDKLISLKNVEWASICIKKPSAIPNADYAMVEFER